jgi:phosphoenolpyruvate synthase/pyruvate phosphate dikinase
LKTISYLEDIGRDNTSSVGGKAAALGELLREGFNVPSGFVLTTEAYQVIIRSLQDRIVKSVTPESIGDPAVIESLAGEVRDWIEGEHWPPSLLADLRQAMTSSSRGDMLKSFAARTSLPSDELATAFGSGVQRAVLGLVGEENIMRGAARCWGALWTSRSMYYRHRKRIPQTQVSLAILVQPMIRAESAGTVFTDEPLSRDRDVLQIESIWGLGAPLTQARVKPDRFLVAKYPQLIKERQVVEKTVKLTVAEDGSLEHQAVPVRDISIASLTDREVMELASIACRIEEFFGEPQRIEWAHLGDQFHVLQAQGVSVRTN